MVLWNTVVPNFYEVIMPTPKENSNTAKRAIAGQNVWLDAVNFKDAAIDLLANMMHLADELGWDFADMVLDADVHHWAEVQEAKKAKGGE
jgi:hypothetical protein